MNKLSIIIVNFNTSHLSLQCIKSIKKYMPSAQIILVDNASAEKIDLQTLKKYKVDLVMLKENLGFSKANNLGAKKAKGDMLFFLNPDTQLIDTTLNQAIDYYYKQDLGILAPQLLNSDFTTQASCFNKQSIANAFKEYVLHIKGAFSKFYPIGKSPTTVNSIVGAAVLISKENFLKIKGWDERYFMYFEDLQLCDNIVKLGKKVVYFPTFKIIHHHGQSVSNKKNLFQINSSKIYHGRIKYHILNYILYSKTKNIIFLALLIRLVLAFFSNSHPDLGNHLDWGEKILSLGPAAFYQNNIWKVSWPNQPPLSIYLFGLMHILWLTLYKVSWYLNTHFSIFPSFLIPIIENKLPALFMKLPFIFSDIFFGILIYKITKSLRMLVFWLYNPVLIYNSTIWGQTDSMVNFLFLASYYFLQKNRLTASLVLLVLCLTFKLSLIILIPVWLISAYHKYGNKVIKSVVIPVVVFLLLSAPFLSTPNPIYGLKHLYLDIVIGKQGNMLNGNAFNLWGVLHGFDFSTPQDIPLLLNITAQQLAYLAFGITYLHILKLLKSDYARFFMVAFIAFVLLTNMHERYLYPIFPWLLLLVYKGTLKFRHYLMFSILHLVNLYNLWFYPDIPFIKTMLISNDFLIPRLLSFATVLLSILYFRHLKNEE